MRKYVIYCYTNKITGKKYIGQTCRTLEKRAGSNGINYINGCPIFGKAIKKHGWESFVVEILEDGLTANQANEREQYWITKSNSLIPFGYNISNGGGSHTLPQSTKQKISNSLKGITRSDETKKKISDSGKGKYVEKNRLYQSKVVRQYTKEGQFIAEYPSTAEASRQLGLNQSNISACCRGIKNHSTVGGFIWRYVEVI